MDKTITRRAAGFTFAELLVGTTLLSLIMAAIYSAFSGNLRAWRSGEEDMVGFRDVRLAADLMRREVQSFVPRSQHLFQGDAGVFEFYASAPPLFLGEGAGTRLMWIRYEVKQGMLVRSEAPVRSPLPPAPPEDEADRRPGWAHVDLGPTAEFNLVRDVEAFRLSYYWMPPGEPRDRSVPPTPVTPIVLQRNRRGLGLPKGMKVEVTIRDPRSESGLATFTSFFRFNGATTTVTEEQLRRLGA